MERYKIIEIQIYNGDTEFLCKRCGCTESWEDVTIDELYNTNGKTRIVSLCPNCEAQTVLKRKKLDMVYMSGGWQEIGALDNNTLMWMYKQGDKYKRHMPWIKAALEGRAEQGRNAVIANNPVTDNLEIVILDEKKELNKEIALLEARISELTNEIKARSATMSYSEAKVISEKVWWNRKQLNKLIKEQ
jgi:hypothetical protein